MAHVATITIDHTKVPGDLTDYVGLIVPDGSAGYSALYALCLEGGGDIRLFKSDDTTELAREIVTFSVSAETGEIHYKYSGTLSSSVDTDIHVYADGSSADYAVTATYGRNAVWAGFRVVYHMNDLLTDSTGNGHNLTNNGGTFENGLFGRGMRFSGAQYARTPASMMTNVGSVSVFYKDNSPASSSILWGCSQIGVEDFNRVWLNANDYRPLIESDSFSEPDNSSSDWSHTVQSWDTATAWENFYNGTLAGTGTGVKNPTTNTRTMLGALGGNTLFTSLPLYFNGIISEWRVSLTRQSLNWTLTEYNNQNSYSTFYSVAAVAGGSAADSERDALITGVATSQSERDALIDGLDTSQSERDALITGVTTSQSQRDALITGVTTSQSQRDALIDGVATSQSERDALITGVADNRQSGERNALITGQGLNPYCPKDSPFANKISPYSEKTAVYSPFDKRNC